MSCLVPVCPSRVAKIDLSKNGQELQIGPNFQTVLFACLKKKIFWPYMKKRYFKGKPEYFTVVKTFTKNITKYYFVKSAMKYVKRFLLL